MLVLEIEYLSGTCFATKGLDSEMPDWPPQPDRIYSALIASWAAHGEPRKGPEKDALRWLECLAPPLVIASAAEPRTGRTAYVPPNDYETPSGELAKKKWYRDYLSEGIAPPEKGGYEKLWLQAWNVLPEQRKRTGLKERTFPAARPHDPLVRLVWPDADPNQQTLTALAALAHDTAYVGHSTSLTRCRFVLEPTMDLSRAMSPQRWVYPGRFDELQREFEAGRRPQPGARVTPSRDSPPARAGVFDERWLLLEHVVGDMPDIRASALVSKAIRTALLSGYGRRGQGDRVPEIVSGHASSGVPSQRPHLAIVPLPFAGFPYADGHVLGFALVPPHDSGLLDDETFLAVLRELTPLDEELNRRVITVTTRTGTSSDRAFSVGLAPVLEPPRRSLDPALYTRKARCFASVTPIVLDRYLKERGEARQEEMAAQIAAACRHIGLPEPSEVVADKHSAIEGAPSAYPSGKAPSWTRWRLPASFGSRQLTHAVVRFAEPVSGPVLLGAGRFAGLGLCRPLDEE